MNPNKIKTSEHSSGETAWDNIEEGVRTPDLKKYDVDDIARLERAKEEKTKRLGELRDQINSMAKSSSYYDAGGGEIREKHFDDSRAQSESAGLGAEIDSIDEELDILNYKKFEAELADDVAKLQKRAEIIEAAMRKPAIEAQMKQFDDLISATKNEVGINNLKKAREAFIEQTVIPAGERILEFDNNSRSPGQIERVNSSEKISKSKESEKNTKTSFRDSLDSYIRQIVKNENPQTMQQIGLSEGTTISHLLNKVEISKKNPKSKEYIGAKKELERYTGRGDTNWEYTCKLAAQDGFGGSKSQIEIGEAKYKSFYELNYAMKYGSFSDRIKTRKSVKRAMKQMGIKKLPGNFFDKNVTAHEMLMLASAAKGAVGAREAKLI